MSDNFIDLRDDFDPNRDSIEIHRTMVFDRSKLTSVGAVDIRITKRVEGIEAGRDVIVAIRNPSASPLSKNADIFLYGMVTWISNEEDRLQQKTGRLLIEMDLQRFRVDSVVSYNEEYIPSDDEDLPGG